MAAPKKAARDNKTKMDERVLQWKNERSLELQRLQTEFELAKLSDNPDKMNELSIKINRLKAELRQK